MKILRLWSAMIVAVLTVGTAQKGGDFILTLQGGSAIPSTPMAFSQNWNMSYGGGGGVEYPVSPSVTVGVNADYYQFNMDAEAIKNSFRTAYMRDIWAFNTVSMMPGASNSYVMSVALNLRIESPDLQGAFRPYVVAGGGVLKYSFAEITLPIKSTIVMNGSAVSMTSQQKITGGEQTDPFLQFGIGVNFYLAPSLGVFAEARYAKEIVKGIGMTFVPLAVGMLYGL